MKVGSSFLVCWGVLAITMDVLALLAFTKDTALHTTVYRDSLTRSGFSFLKELLFVPDLNSLLKNLLDGAIYIYFPIKLLAMPLFI
jgi:hypothetical protein